MTLRVAVVQMSSGNNKEENVERAKRLIEKAAGNKAKFIVLPEMFHFRGSVKSLTWLRENVAEAASGPTIKAIKALAKKRKICILAGSIFEKIAGQKKVGNASFLIGPDGRIISKYQKINLFRANVLKTSFDESARFVAGKKLAQANVGGFSVGLSICYDLRFSEIYRNYARKGVEVLCIPSAFTAQTGEAHWETLLRARAIETMAYVLAPNQYGVDTKGVEHYGNSMIIDPWGKVLARGSKNRTQILYANIDKKVIKQYQKVLPKIRKKG